MKKLTYTGKFGNFKYILKEEGPKEKKIYNNTAYPKYKKDCFVKIKKELDLKIRM